MKNEEIKNDIISKEVSEEAGLSQESETNGQSMSALQKMIGIVLSPIETLKALEYKPTVLLPMIVVPILSMLYYLIFWNDYEVEAIRALEAQFSAINMELTSEMLEMQLSVMKVSVPAMVVVFYFIGILVNAVYYWVVCKIVKSKVTFKKIMSLVVHISVISIFTWVLYAVMTSITGEANITESVTSIASLLPESIKGTFMYGFISPIEVFSLWGLCLTYFGLRIMAKISKRSAMISVGVLLLLQGLMVGGSLVLSSFLSGLA